MILLHNAIFSFSDCQLKSHHPNLCRVGCSFTSSDPFTCWGGRFLGTLFKIFGENSSDWTKFVHARAVSYYFYFLVFIFYYSPASVIQRVINDPKADRMLQFRKFRHSNHVAATKFGRQIKILLKLGAFPLTSNTLPNLGALQKLPVSTNLAADRRGLSGGGG